MRSPLAAAAAATPLLAPLLLLLGALGCSEAPVTPYEPVLCDSSGAPCVDVRVVAHQDDDLLFMNPDIAASLAAGNRAVTIFVTAGTPFDQGRLIERETGILNAYTFMVAPDAAVLARGEEAPMLARWRLHGGQPIAVDIPGGVRYAIQYDFASPLPSGGALSIVFLRVVEENPVDLQALLRGDVAQLPTVACETGCVLGSALAAQTYDEAQLVDVLEALYERFSDRSFAGGLAVSTLDATQLYHRKIEYGLGWVDHADHLAAADLAVKAFIRHHRREHPTPWTLHQYRAYNTGREPANLGDETLAKRQTFYRYYVLGELLSEERDGELIEHTNRNPDDPHFRSDPYEAWTERRYLTSSLPPARVRLAVGDPPRCLYAAGGSAGAGAGVELGPCDEAPTWDTGSDASLRPTSDRTSCLTLDAGTDLARLAPCFTPPAADGERQTFVYTSTGQFRTRGGGCLQADANGVTGAACDKRVDGDGDPIGRPVRSQEWSWQ